MIKSEIREPKTAEEFEQYYDLRWRKLRMPWNQPKGSEQDELEKSAVHRMICNEKGKIIAVGRLHFNSPGEAQVRFMAVEDSYQGKGLGSEILKDLEKQAKEKGAKYIVLNARDTAIPFYEKHGYKTVKETITLFGEIPHFVMKKELK